MTTRLPIMIRLILSKSSSFWLYYLLAGLVLVPVHAAEPEAAPSEAAVEANSAYDFAMDEGDYEEALRHAQAFQAAIIEQYGESHMDYIRSLVNLAGCLDSLSRFDEALPLYREILLKVELVQGKSHSDYGFSLYLLARCLNSLSRFEEALPLYREVLLNVEMTMGKEHWHYGASLNNLAGCLGSLSRYDEALPLHREALLITEITLGKSDSKYGTSLYNLAENLSFLGHYDEALSLCREALLNAEVSLGKKHQVYGERLSGLAAILDFLGRYDEALPLYREALLNTELVLGKSHRYYSASLNGLALCLNSLGRFEEALALSREALLYAESVRGKMDPDYGTCLNNLAGILNSLGRYEEALALSREALINAELALGKTHPDYGLYLLNVGSYLNSLGRFEEALPLHREALLNTELALGKSHRYYSAILNNLAACLDSLGRSEEALQLLREALLNGELALGKSHQIYGQRLSNVGSVLESLGRFEEALPQFRESLEVAVRLLERDSVFRSEQEQLRAAERVSRYLDNYIAAKEVSESEGFEQVLRWKGAVLTRQRAVRLAAEDPEVAPIFEALQANAAQLAALSGNYPEALSEVDAWKAQMDALTDNQETLERELNAMSSVYREGTKRVTLEELQSVLQDNALLLDYFVYERAGVEQLLVHAVDADSVTRYELGALEPIERAIRAWRQALGSRLNDAESGRALRKLIWDPLSEAIAGHETLLVCPDGPLGSVPFAALPGESGETRLIEKHRMALVPVPQLLPALLRGDHNREAGKGLMTIGDVDYDQREGETDAPVEASESWRRDRSVLASSIRGGVSWTPLPETAGEIARIDRLFRDVFNAPDEAVASYDGSGASELVFREEAGQYYHLHIATHGFFAAPEVKSALAVENRESGSTRSGFGDEHRSSLSGYDPNLLSGLVFSGANLTPDLENSDDGILTSREISFLSLEGVDLVTLSACETGLGDVAGGEGLLGIQRAFQVSGARSTIASLWTVDDRATRMLMERFYLNYWEKKMSKLDAMREAQLEIFRDPDSVRAPDFEDEEKLPTRTHPYYWAAFQLSGDWR